MHIYSGLYADFHPFNIFFPKATCSVARVPDDLQESGILIIHGGGDIHPSLYNRKKSVLTGAGNEPSQRDRAELALVLAAKERGIMVMGICRGAQLLCAAAGGYLIQDVTSHGTWGGHAVTTHDGKTVQVNSLHHQMMMPFEVDHELLAWSTQKQSRHYVDEDRYVSVPKETEAVFFPGLGLGVQWHPEMLDENTECNLWLKEELVRRGIQD